MTPTYEEISVREVIANAKMKLRLTNTTEHDLYLEVLANEALDSLDALSQLVKDQCDLTFTNNQAELPKNFSKLLALRLNGCTTTLTNDPIANQLINNCNIAVYVDTKFLDTCGCDTNSWGINNITPYGQGFQINKGFIHFNYSQDVAQVNTAVLAYMGLNVDENGDSVIYRRYERAVSAYVRTNFMLTWAENYNQYVIEKASREWVNQRSKLIGQDVAKDFQNNKYEINKYFNSLLVSRSVNLT